MKRLTIYEGRIAKHNECEKYVPCGWCTSCDKVQNMVNHLATIKDILGDDYDLDRLRELVKADKEGRCGIPPVKMHQKIFRVFDGEIYEEIVCGAIWEPLTPRQRWRVFVMGHGMPYFVDEVFGKTVFLTRTEAEAALKAREQG